MEHAVHPDRYGRHWLVFLAVLAVAGGIWWQVNRIPPRQAVSAPASDADWFLILRMPAVTAQYESGIDTMRGRYGEWLESLSREGFKPMLLSDVYRRLRAGEGIPSRTVVMVFDPGYRRTYQVVDPILTEHNWPAVWMSPVKEMDQGHREYMTYHQAQKMTQSGWWDVGLIQKNGSIRLQSKDHPDVLIGSESNSPWSPRSGGVALNEGQRFQGMQRLNVNSDWTAADLVNRSLAEVPIREPAYLTLGQVQNLSWGITTPANSSDEKHFNLSVPIHRHGTQVAWFGPRHFTDFRVEAEAEGLVGQLALRFRWSEVDDTGVVITLSNRDVSVKSKGDAHIITVREMTRSGAGPQRPLKLAAELRGRTLAISVDGRPFQTVELPPKTPVRGGLFQVYLYDSVKGTALINSMKLLFTPLS